VESLLFFALILVAFYFLIIRPQRTRARQADQMRARLAPGVEVMTTAGLYGTVVEVLDDSVRLEVSPGVVVRSATAAVGRIVADDASADTAAETGPEDTPVVDLTDQAGDTDHHAEDPTRRTNAGE
jgi:preprotein translocase subunit YajC